MDCSALPTLTRPDPAPDRVDARAPRAAPSNRQRSAIAAPPRSLRGQRPRPRDRDPEPPGAGNGDGDGDDGHGRVPAAGGHGPWALGLLLVGISILFLVLLAVWLLMRRTSPEWMRPGDPRPPHALWLSTAVLVGSSLVLHLSTRRRGVESARLLGLSLALGLGFLVVQGFLWRDLHEAGLLPGSSGYAAVFYALTGVHALHVLVGVGVLVWLVLAARRADDGGPPAAALRLGSIYWHFMGAVWLLLFVLLYFVR